METQTSFPQLRHKRNCENEARTHTHTRTQVQLGNGFIVLGTSPIIMALT